MSLISRLCASFPSGGDLEPTIRVYLDDTADIPLPWLTEGLRAFKNESERRFLPSIAEIRTACAKAVRRARRDARGEEDRGGPLDVPQLLRWATNCAPLGHAQVHRIEGPRKRRDALAAANVENAARIPQGKRGKSVGMALSEVLGGVTVVDGDGHPVPIAKIAHEIWCAGTLVPPKNHENAEHAIQGLQLATMIAAMRLGHEAVPVNFYPIDWERLSQHMERFRKEWPDKADTTWWDEVREQWWTMAKRNEQQMLQQPRML